MKHTTPNPNVPPPKLPPPETSRKLSDPVTRKLNEPETSWKLNEPQTFRKPNQPTLLQKLNTSGTPQKTSLAPTPLNLQLDLTPPTTGFTTSEAVEIIRQIQVVLESIEDYRLKLNWFMGFVLAHTHRPRGSTPTVFAEITGRLISEHGIKAGKSTLYECDKLYRLFGGNRDKFEDWIRSEKMRLRRTIYWFDVQERCLGGKSNPDVIGAEAADERDLLQVELAIEALARLIRRAQEGSEDAQGVLVALL